MIKDIDAIYTCKNLQAEDRSFNTTSAWLGEVLRWLLLFPVLRLFVTVKAYGTENIKDRGPYIFAPNHSSHLDTPALLAALPLRLRLSIHVAAAADYFFATWWKGALSSILLNTFAFERKGNGRAASLERARQILRAGGSLLLFPEGTRTKDGQLQPFKYGISKLALAEPVRVIPVWIEGTFQALPKGARWPRRQHVAIRFGVPLRFVPGTELVSVTARIEQQVKALAL